MKKIKAILFDIDNTLYDTGLLVESARRNAVKAMVEAGLNATEDEALEKLKKIVRKYGPNYDHHYNKLLEAFGHRENPHIIAAGIVAYHDTKKAYLVPYLDTVPTLLRLKKQGYRVGVITEGLKVKQWEKLIRLGLQHFFDTVTITEKRKGKLDPKIFGDAVKKLGCKPDEVMMVGDRVDKDVPGAKKAGLVTVQLMKGSYSRGKPKNKSEEPDFVISQLADLLRILDRC